MEWCVLVTSTEEEDDDDDDDDDDTQQSHDFVVFGNETTQKKDSGKISMQTLMNKRLDNPIEMKICAWENDLMEQIEIEIGLVYESSWLS